jgi:hypothetical protein
MPTLIEQVAHVPLILPVPYIIPVAPLIIQSHLFDFPLYYKTIENNLSNLDCGNFVGRSILREVPQLLDSNTTKLEGISVSPKKGTYGYDLRNINLYKYYKSVEVINSVFDYRNITKERIDTFMLMLLNNDQVFIPESKGIKWVESVGNMQYISYLIEPDFKANFLKPFGFSTDGKEVSGIIYKVNSIQLFLDAKKGGGLALLY